MFVLTTVAYPVVLALLCTGAGLLVDRASGERLAAMLLAVSGAAVLVVISQLTTYFPAIAPATPYALVAIAIAGFLFGRRRFARLAGTARSSLAPLLAAPLAYALALAPVLLSGRPTFSSYMALADSAVHMLGAYYLLAHGQDYAHLSLASSYGATLHAYYGSSYPSGADTLLGGSAWLLGLPLIWAYQPLTAFLAALASGPAWVLVKRVGVPSHWSLAATLTVTLPALVYAYELIGSIKEILALPLILALGALATQSRPRTLEGARAAIPFAVLVAAGLAAIGVAFAAWALVATLTLLAGGSIAKRRLRTGVAARVLAAGAGALLVCAWPTWAQLSGSLSVAKAIATTSNPGNLHTPLRVTQLFGVWLQGSYKLLPAGGALTATSILIALALLAALLGMGYLLRSGRFTLALWLALTLALWLLLHAFATTWTNAKALMLTSPAVVLAAWAGIAALRGSRLWVLAPLVGSLLVAGVLVSDALQYHQSDLAPTARYDELAALDRRFAGRGPALFTDFDEYALYELRDLQASGPDFAYPPPQLAAAAGGYGRPVRLDRIAPRALAAYRLIVTRREPDAVRPPAAYRLLWRGDYYEVWGRAQHAVAALAHVALHGPRAARCRTIGRVAAGAPRGALLSGASAPELVQLRLVSVKRPHGWGRGRVGIAMRGAGTLHARFSVPGPGSWLLWLKGQVMRPVRVLIDGRTVGTLGGQLGGNSLVENTLTPLAVSLSRGAHSLAIVRGGTNLAPGNGGAAVIAAIALTRAGEEGEPSLRSLPARDWRGLCGLPLQWVEVERLASAKA